MNTRVQTSKKSYSQLLGPTVYTKHHEVNKYGPPLSDPPILHSIPKDYYIAIKFCLVLY